MPALNAGDRVELKEQFADLQLPRGDRHVHARVGDRCSCKDRCGHPVSYVATELMRSKRVLTTLAVSTLLAAPAVVGQSSAPRDDAFPLLKTIPVVSDHQYCAAGAIHPFPLFWINRSNVGGARITRRRQEDGTIGLEMLTGSDPARAPLGVNRWGYISEVIRGTVLELIAVKTQTNEETIEDAKSNATNHNAGRFLLFIRERVTPAESSTWTAIADVGREASFHDLDVVLDRMPSITNWKERRLTLPPNTRPGFLTAFTELMDATAKSLSAAGESALHRAPKTLTYVHRSELFDLREDQIEPVNDFDAGTQGHVQAVRAKFSIWNRRTRQSSGDFTAIYGVNGALTGVPLRMTYQPRWWLRTEMTIDDTNAYSASR